MSAPHNTTETPTTGLVTTHLRLAAQQGASDLLLVADAPPTIFLGGRWQAVSDSPMSADAVAAALHDLLTPKQRERLDHARDLDLAIQVPGVGRFRANFHFQRGTLAAAFRMIPFVVPSFDTLNLPSQIINLVDVPNGLVCITGGTGQGKSTTLATLVDHLNHTRRAHIVTIEDPVEFTFSHGDCIIEQREIGDDSPTFASALRHVLRQRPDVIVIGEMRDLETIATALTAAETGHLVLASLHTSGAVQTLARIVDVFPAVQQPQIRVQLAGSLRAVVSQSLLREDACNRLVPATEILVATSAIRRAIREDETHLIYSMMETGRRFGMHVAEQSLAALVKSGRVNPEEALAVATEPARLAKLIGRNPDDVATSDCAWAGSAAEEFAGAVSRK